MQEPSTQLGGPPAGFFSGNERGLGAVRAVLGGEFDLGPRGLGALWLARR